MMYSKITHITLTGVDDHTNLGTLVALSRRYPLVEWGFLFSPKRQGQGGRYPSIDTLSKAFKLLPKNIRVALHVCGAGVPNLLVGEGVVKGLVEAVDDRGGRVQLNFNHSRDSIDLNALSNVLKRFPTVKFIIQHNEANKDVWRHLRSHANYLALFDSSGGQGIECGTWPAPLPGIHCGYAGGLGPDNLAAALRDIRAAAGEHSFWIDMEGKLRSTDNVFDLHRAGECLKTATTSLGMDKVEIEPQKTATA